MNKKAALAMMMGVEMSLLPKEEQPTQIQSYKTEQKKEVVQLSKRQIQKMKGKKARKNRGRKR